MIRLFCITAALLAGPPETVFAKEHTHQPYIAHTLIS
jgi:hypothetical protein